MQKFRFALKTSCFLEPNGKNKNQNSNMEVAIHFRRTKQREYDFKDLDAKMG